jgi:hypothetical protein
MSNPDPNIQPLAEAPLPAPPTPITQPQSSKITCIPTPDTLTFIIPRTGFTGVAAFVLLFAAIWLGISGTVLIAFLVTFVRHFNLQDLAPLLILPVFLLIGLVALLISLQLAFRKAVLLATRDSLVYTQSGPLRKSEFQYNASDLQSIRIAPSNVAVNGRQLPELKILSKSTTPRGLFTGREDNELNWLAYTLTSFYNLPL